MQPPANAAPSSQINISPNIESLSQEAEPPRRARLAPGSAAGNLLRPAVSLLLELFPYSGHGDNTCFVPIAPRHPAIYIPSSSSQPAGSRAGRLSRFGLEESCLGAKGSGAAPTLCIKSARSVPAGSFVPPAPEEAAPRTLGCSPGTRLPPETQGMRCFARTRTERSGAARRAPRAARLVYRHQGFCRW